MCILGYNESKIDRFWREVDTVYDNLTWLSDFNAVSTPITLKRSRVMRYHVYTAASVIIPRASLLVGFIVSVLPVMLWS